MQSTALTPLGALTVDERCSLREAQHLSNVPAARVAVSDPRGWAVSTCWGVAGKGHRPSVVLVLVPGGTNLASWRSAVDSHRLCAP